MKIAINPMGMSGYVIYLLVFIKYTNIYDSIQLLLKLPRKQDKLLFIRYTILLGMLLNVI